jgi:O-antigen ligase
MNFFQAGAFGSVFWVWVMCLAVGQIVFNNRLAWIHRAGLCLLVALVWYVAFFFGRDWTSGWLPALAGVGIMAWLGFPKLRFPLVLLGILAAAVGWKVLYGVYESTVLTPDNLYSQMTRVEAWKILLRIFQENPIFGLGPANYYDYTPLFPILGYAVSFNSHSNYIDLLVETGILGFGCFIWFMTEVFRLSLKLQHRVEAGFQKGFVISVMGGVVGTLVAAAFGDWVIPFVYNIGFDGFRGSVIAWIFMGGLVAVDRFTRQKAQAEN